MAFYYVAALILLMMGALLWSLAAGSPGVTLIMVGVCMVIAIGIVILARRQAPRW